MTEPISFSELEEKLRDITIDEDELAVYFTADPSKSKPFAPVLGPNPELVELSEVDEFRVEGAFAMDWANGIARWRRRKRFQQRDHDNDSRLVLVSEGDSWFQFPIFLKDVIDRLDDDYNIWSVGSAGDDLEGMVVNDPEYLEALEKHADRFQAFLFSGGGNDIVGEKSGGGSYLEEILKPFEPGRPPEWYLQTDAFGQRLNFIEQAYRTVLESVEREFTGKPVLLQGYDYAIPGGFSGDTRDPRWAKKDQWIGQYLRGETLQFQDVELERAVVRLMIDRLNEMQRRLCGGNNDGGAFSNAFHVDNRNTMRDIDDWADELHPTSKSFKKVVRNYLTVLNQAGVPVPASTV